MRSLVCEMPGSLKLEDRPEPAAGSGDVLIRVRRVGICGTDLHIFAGRQPYLSYPRVMGHEFAGVVEQAPMDSGLSIGDPVTVMPYLSCGDCVACRKGKTNCCQKLDVLGVHRDGALADYVAVPAHAVLKTEGISLDQAAMVEFLSIGAHAVHRAQIASGERVLIVGAGPIGLAAALFSKLHGSEVTMVDGRQDRLAFARDMLSIDHIVPASADVPATLDALTDGMFFDAVFDATGNPAAMEAGFGYVAHGGRYALISIVSADIRFSDPEFHKRETTLLACRNATMEDFRTVIAAMRAGQVPTEAFATHRATLESVASELPNWGTPDAGVIKAIVEL
jgi:2-desacetyl-2-hydroxyethyl bacteriochlorophyllide A dehydrogenase